MSIPAQTGAESMMDSSTSSMAERIRLHLGKRSIVFVGLMGAGKTAIGRRVAQMLGIGFVDSDHEIENVSRMTVTDLFELYGEPEFRALETRVVQRLLRNGPQVISTGGGAFISDKIRAAIARHGIAIWLKADIDLLMERVSRRQDRPLLKDPDPRGVMSRLIDARYPVYALADLTVESQDVSREEMAERVISALDRYLEGMHEQTNGASR